MKNYILIYLVILGNFVLVSIWVFNNEFKSRPDFDISDRPPCLDTETLFNSATTAPRSRTEFINAVVLDSALDIGSSKVRSWNNSDDSTLLGNELFEGVTANILRK